MMTAMVRDFSVASAIHVLLVAVVSTGLSTQAQGQTFGFISLGTPHSAYSEASDINESGAIVGAWKTSDSTVQHAFYYKNGKMLDLGTLGTNSGAFATNASGQTVGSSHLTTDNIVRHAFLATAGSMIDLGTLGGRYSIAENINDRGEVIGTSENSNGRVRAFLYSDGVMRDLGTLGGSDATASGINSVGQIVGKSYTAEGDTRGFLYDNGIWTNLGTLESYTHSYASEINDNGLIIGAAYTPSGFFYPTRSFLYQDGMKTDLGTLGGNSTFAEDINSHGDVVGSSTTDGYDDRRAFLYTGGRLRDLNTMLDGSAAGWTLHSASGINEAGWIVGTARKDGVNHAYLLTPVVPEPRTSLTCWAIALVSLRRRRSILPDATCPAW